MTPFTDLDFETGKGYYNYFLKLPVGKVTKENMMQEQTMLKQNFGYNAKIETRQMPVWKLEASSKAFKILKTKGAKLKKLE